MSLLPHSFNGVIIDSGLSGGIEDQHYFIRVNKNLRPNFICLNCETVSEGDRINFEWEGVVGKIWKLAFERISPSASDGPRNARLHRRDRAPDKIRTQVLISDIDDRAAKKIERGSFILSVDVGGKR